MNNDNERLTRRAGWRLITNDLGPIGGVDLCDGISSVAVADDSSHPRFVPSRTLRVRRDGSVLWIHNERRLIDRLKEDKNMKALAKLIHVAGRSAVLVGSALALGCAVVIVSNAPALAPVQKVAIEQKAAVVRLEPVVVTISSERFDAIHAEAQRPSMFVWFFAKKPHEV